MSEVPVLFSRALNSPGPLAALLASGVLLLSGAQAFGQEGVQDRLRYRLETAALTDSMQVMDEQLQARASLRRLYLETQYQPLWVSADGPTPAALTLLEWIERETPRQGLDPGNYHVAVLEAVDDVERSAAIVDFELALSDAFLLLASHLLAGHLNPETLDAEWRANRRHRDLLPVIMNAAAQDHPGAVLADLLPDDPDYSKLVDSLAKLRELRAAGGWDEVPGGPTLRAGDEGERVAALSSRLQASGDLAKASGDRFDAELEAAVMRFQSRHGLTADGAVGRDTLRALNVPVRDRIRQVIVNLERWRWLPESLGDRYVIVNIAGFSLDVVEADRSTMSMRVVVGKPYRRTPVFSGQISYLVLNPFWEVPTSIAVKDKLPLIKADPEYLARNGFTVLQNWGVEERIIDATTIDWQSVPAAGFPYRLRQSPGPMNALGRVKIMFPNDFAVYLHDTPSRELFSRDSRPFSSGCIRLERPLDLAAYLLKDTAQWNREQIDRVVAAGTERTVMLPDKVPVHLLYWTAWSGDDDVLNFREDIYGRDALVLKNLREPPPEL